MTRPFDPVLQFSLSLIDYPCCTVLSWFQKLTIIDYKFIKGNNYHVYYLLNICNLVYEFQPDQNWEIDIDDLERQIDRDTVAIIINNPSNPCGSVYSAEHLTAVLAVAGQHRVPIIADEIYEHLVNYFISYSIV